MLDCYVPRGVLRRLVQSPNDPVESLDGTLVFADISGFTRLSERLARKGPEGAEQLVDAINSCFTALLADAYGLGGSLVKFGGDALLVWFEGHDHAARACASAVAMRRTLRRVGRVTTGTSQIVLRMSIGVHSGHYETFLVGGSHREYFIAGEAATKVVAIEAIANAGQILLTRETAELLPAYCLGPERGPGVMLARAPVLRLMAPDERPFRPDDDAVARCLSTAVRAHVLARAAPGVHRSATIAFVQFGGLDGLIEQRGADAAAPALDQLVRIAAEAADRYEISLLGSDVAAGGGKLIFAGGAPRAVGDDEERTLLAMRQILDAGPELPVRIGINRGQVFGGEIGARYRRTYTVMGDAVNLAARLMSAAQWGTVLATGGVLGRSRTRFDTTEMMPLTLKGKSRPVEALEVGAARRAVRPAAARPPLPLIGRERELERVRSAISDARVGRGALIELVGETGSGKSRLLAEARAIAGEMRFVHATCETYTRDVPYIGWRDPLRQLLGLSWEDPDQVVLARLQEEVAASCPELLPWLPLLAIAIDAEMPPTREVQELAPEFREAKLHEVVLQFLAPALAVPTLVQIEHCHLMDDASADLLQALAGRLTRSAWVVILTRREVAAGFVAPDAVKVELGPLSEQASLALAEATPEAHLLPPHVLALAVERSGGSPEFLLDLLAAAAAGSGTLPDSIEAATSARLDALEPGDRAFVRRVSVLGLSFHPDRVRDVLADEDAEPADATWERLSAIFARDPDGHIRFKRPALREVAYHSLPFRLRRTLHASVAMSLERERGQNVDADPAVLSLHFILAGHNDRAWRYAKAGAERAAARFAVADAARLYRRAIEAGRQDGANPVQLAACWEALGDALQRSGELAAAAEAVTAARRLVPGDRLAQARLFFLHTRIARRSAGLSAAVRWAWRGLRSLDGLDDQDAIVWRARLLGSLGYTRLAQNRPVDAEALCRAAITAAEAVGELPALAYALYVLDLALTESGRLAEAVNSPRALEIYTRIGDTDQQGSVLNNMAAMAYHRWCWDEALELYGRAAECFRRAGNPGDLAATECNIGEILSDRGRYEDAAVHLNRACRVWRSTGDHSSVPFAHALLGRLAVRAGEGEEGVALLRDAAAQLHRYGEKGEAGFAESLLAEAEAFAGDPSAALEGAARLLGAASRERPLLHRVRGVALARRGDCPGAARELQCSLSIAREHRALYEIAATLDVLDGLALLDAKGIAERDAVLGRLRIDRLPELGLQDGAAAQAPQVVRL